MTISASMRRRIAVWGVLALMIQAGEGFSDPAPLRIYLDADRSGARRSGVAIEQGIRTAFHENGNRLGDRPVELVIKDHRGSTPRSGLHLKQFLKDPRALAVFGGLHSPPLLAHRTFINQNEIPVLVPWAAAGPITRYADGTNWIFRLSIDDSKAGYVITRYAVGQEGFKRPCLLLEETGWGRSNDQTMNTALGEYGLSPNSTEWFSWNVGPNVARMKLRKIAKSGADVIFLVANANEGKTFAQAMVALPEEDRLPIRSHWGITGGDFASVIDAESRSKLDLLFIQTRFSFLSTPPAPAGVRVLKTASSLFPDIKQPSDIHAPAGFIHAYDITRILIAAAEGITWTDAADENRRILRNQLETVVGPVDGLLKTYRHPFRPWTREDPDAHEALGMEDIVMARFGPRGEILLVPAGQAP